MSFDFMKNLMMAEDEEGFARLCEAIEDVIRETGETGRKFSDLELMQVLDYVGFNLFRDDWEEFKKMEMPRDFVSRDRQSRKNFIN